MQVQSGTVGLFQLPNMPLLADVHLGLQTTPLRKAQWFPLTRFAGQRASIVASQRCSLVSLPEYFRSVSDAGHQRSKRRPPTPFDGSAGPPGPAEIFPRTAIRVAL